MTENIYAFLETMRAAGLEPPEHIETSGSLIRFDIDAKGDKAGWYIFHADGVPAGQFGNWKTGLSEKWCGKDQQAMTEAERAEQRRFNERAKAQREAQRLADQELAATKAAAILSGAASDPAGHAYAATKKVSFGPLVKRGPWAQRGWADALLVPLFEESGSVVSVQAISANLNDKKDFLFGGRKKGCFHPLGKFRGATGRVLLGEGLATVAAAASVTGLPGVVAFDAGNLQSVVEIVRKLAPMAQIVILADDDRKPDTEKNHGIEEATKAALAVGGVVAVPGLGRKADFWDVLNEQGADAVRQAIEGAVRNKLVRSEVRSADAPAVDQESAVSETPIDPAAMIQQLAGLSAVEYELKRKAAAEALGIRASALDRAVKEAKKGKDENDLPFDEPDPWPVPVDSDQLLTDIASAIQRFIVCSKEVAHTVALWAAMSWFMEVVQVAPLAVITAPEKRCGKSQLLFLLGRLSARSITASSISPAALYRAIDAWSPTLLIDEADAFMKDNEELRGIINSGHTRDSAYVIRTVGDTFTPTKFNTWGAKAIAGIGHIADTLMDRAVILELRRKLPHESVDRLRYAEPDLFHNLRSKLARFAEDYSEQVRQARPPLPAILNDRAQDNWEPLLAIAMVAGGRWLEIGTAAALKLSGTESAAQTIGTELLADIQEIFEAKDADRISTADLIKALCEDDEKVWSTYNRGNPIKPRQLANKLKGYGISSNTLRFKHSGTAKGYERDQFEESFSRYLAPPPLPSVTPLQPSSTGHLGVTDSENVTVTVTDRAASNIPINRNCYAVTDRAPSPGENKVEVEI